MAGLPRDVFDVVVIGSGIAGLIAALRAARSFSVCLLTKGEIRSSATRFAQGGMAVATAEPDSPRLHLEDTVRAGAGLVNEPAAKVLAEEGPAALQELVAMGARFDRKDGDESRAREGGHSVPRILHMGDMTGRAIEEVLVGSAQAKGAIAIRENVFCLDLIVQDGRCAGVIAQIDGSFRWIAAGATVLATGGAGQLYSVTTNPPLVTGDGMAMALRAGASLCDMEFIQFHPTSLHVPETPRFLITEALRGEGAYLVGKDGKRFMKGVHPLEELAPRDIVVREMVRTMRRTDTDHVLLDARHIDEEILINGYPTIYSHCKEAGFDLKTDMIPVSFAAHFTIGGIAADLDGRSDLPGLFASGEVASNGVHGANRLASNSLLEGLVFSRRIVRALEADPPSRPPALGAEESYPGAESIGKVREPNFSATQNTPGMVPDPAEARRQLGELMTSLVGAVRNEEGLSQADRALSGWNKGLFARFAGPEGWELQNLLTLAQLVAGAALERRETRGVHYREDYPRPDEAWGRRNIYWKCP